MFKSNSKDITISSFEFLAPFGEQEQKNMAKCVRDLADAFGILFTEPIKTENGYQSKVKYEWLSKWQITLKGESNLIEKFKEEAKRLVISQ